MPLYDTIKQELRDTMKFVTNISVPVAWRRQYCGIFEAKYGGVTYYLLDNEYYFKRGSLYGHYDDAERFAFFSRAILEIIPHIDFKPDIIHCNDWQTALTPLYYSTIYATQPGYENIKTVFTIHNIQYQGVYGKELIDNVIGLDYSHKNLIEYDDTVNFSKAAIECANAVSTVSPSYAKEILDPWYSHGLDTILKERSFKLRGILNGIDVENYNPETDKDIFKNYSAEKMTGKATNKRELQKFFGLPEKKDTPVMGMVTRLVSHKGLDLCKAVLDELLATTDIQLVVLGSGDTEYEDFFRGLAARFPEQVGLCLGFIPDLARKIYAGSDLFLMPSKSEPCGLSQMVALRYGSIPIVRETGGLRDSVKDSGDNEGNGFTFANYNAHEMLHAIRRACEGYSDKKGWKILVKRAMESDNSWGKSANEYIKMYKEILKQ
jgi:starch synthase